MSLSRYALCLITALLPGLPAMADMTSTQSGTDLFIGGDTLLETLDAPGDVFLAGQTAVARGTTKGDLHVAGMDLSISTATGQDLYAMGAVVMVLGAVGEDLSAIGMTVRTDPMAEVGGNARLLGRTVTIEGPISGALMATGQDVLLNAVVSGDARIYAQSLSFGPQAKVMGQLTYGTEDPVTVPGTVAPADRVIFERLQPHEFWENMADMRDMDHMPAMPGFGSVLFGFVVSLLFFVALAMLALGFMPKRLEQLRANAARAPGKSLLLGGIGLSVLFGMVPIAGLTIIGLPLVPIALLAIVVAWILGYALGAYAVAMRIWTGFGGDAQPGNVPRLLIFAAALTLIAVLNFIPFFGWVVNYTLVLVGVGAITRALLPSLPRGTPSD